MCAARMWILPESKDGSRAEQRVKPDGVCGLLRHSRLQDSEPVSEVSKPTLLMSKRRLSRLLTKWCEVHHHQAPGLDHLLLCLPDVRGRWKCSLEL